MSTPFKWGSEFLVNTTTLNSQERPTITALADGRFVVAWTDSSLSPDDSSGRAVRAQILNADGSKFGDEFLVNTTTVGHQEQSTIVALADGGFVIAWADGSQTGDDTSGAAVRAQMFNPDGSKSGQEFLVNTTTIGTQNQPTITAFADGRFVIAWVDGSVTGDDTSGTAIRAQMFSPDGSKSGEEFLVNTTTVGQQDQPTITALADDRFVVAWRDGSQTGGDTSDTAIRAQVFNPDGSKSGEEVLVNTTVLWKQEAPNIAALANSGFVAAWRTELRSDDDFAFLIGWEIRAQIFNSDGARVGAEFTVNAASGLIQDQPTITGLADGRFVVAWVDSSQTGGDTSGVAIHAQVFNADGSKSGSEFLVNTTTSGPQSALTITVLSDGRLVIGWTDGSQSPDDPSGSAVRGQIFDPRIAAVTLKGTLGNDEYFGTNFADFLRGSFGNDRLHGAGGDDELWGEWGDDSLFGGNGNDRLSGGPGDDWLFGGPGSDLLEGGDGNDVLDGGLGVDALVGGLGNDLLIVDRAADIVVELPGEGQDTVQSGQISLDLANYANVEHAKLTGNADLNLTGNAFANELTGNAGNNLIQGLGGNDTLLGGGGDDTLLGGPGADVLDGGEGNDVLKGGGGADVLIGGPGNDRLVVDRYADVVIEQPGEGQDTVQSGQISLDLANYANVEHAKLTGNADLNLTGNAFANQLIGNTGSNVIQGLGGNDTLWGVGGDDSLEGGPGNDVLRGGAGSDTLDGGAGNDRLFGGDGADTFVFAPGHNTARIKDMQDDIDTIDLTGFGFGNVNQAVGFGNDVGGNVVFDFAGGERLIVENITKAQLGDDILV